MISMVRYISFIFLLNISKLLSYDVTIVGPVGYFDGLGRISIGIIDAVKNDLQINCIPTYLNLNHINIDVQSILLHPDKTPGKVSLFTGPLWYVSEKLFKKVPKESKIKIAYTMLEGTKIPSMWVKILNHCFDAAVVPDSFLVSVYQNCGVKIPIFVLPLGMYLDEFLCHERKNFTSSPFIFGSTVSCDERKNYSLLIQAFAEEFGNQDNVILKLNARGGIPEIYKAQINILNVSNIIFTHEVLDKVKYLDFLSSFDCFINISKGEGFSLCPREAMALGIPCILSKNSAQITLCDTGFVKEVPSLILEPANYFGLFGNKTTGYFSSPSKEDVRAALRDMYQNYFHYKQKAIKSQEWVSKYSWTNLKGQYLSLIKPKRVFLGDRNEITEEYLMTDSKKLFYKYNKILGYK